MKARFTIRTVPLAFAAVLTFGCWQGVVEPVDAPADISSFEQAPVALAWHEAARNLVAANRLSAPAAGRVYAALGVAQHRAVKQVDGTLIIDENDSNGFGIGGRALYEARRGAVAGASARVLTFFFPAAEPSLAQLVSDQGSDGPGEVHPYFAQGEVVGRAAGDVMVVHVQTDGFSAPWNGTVPTGPGIWTPTSLPPGAGMLPFVKPYFMAANSQFRPAPPPAFMSGAFNTDLNEVLTRAQNRTPAELTFARQWDYPAGTYTPLGYWNDVASDYVAASGLDERAATEVFSLMHSAMFDALIACWEAKYHYWLLRPSHANPAIPLAFTLPNFPAYPSGHSCASAAGARVLAHYFPANAAELAGWVDEAGLSRILAGIHYRFDVTSGQMLGTTVAEFALARGAR